MRHLLLLAIGIAVAGCAQNRPATRADSTTDDRYVPRIVCAATPSQLTPHALPPAQGRGSRVDFRGAAQCVHDADGAKVPALLYRIDGIATPIALRARLLTDGDNALAVGVSVLDARFGEIDRFGFDRFQQRGSDYQLDAFINRSEPPAAYLLLTPDSAWMDRKARQVTGSRWVAPIITPTLIATYADGSEGSRQVRFRDMGELTLRAIPEQGSSAAP